MLFSNKYFIRNVSYLQEALPHRKMGGGGDLVLKVIAHTLEERKKRVLSIGLTPLTCFPSSLRSRAAAHSGRAWWGGRFRENAAVAGQEESCSLVFSVGRETEMGRRVYATQLLILFC